MFNNQHCKPHYILMILVGVFLLMFITSCEDFDLPADDDPSVGQHGFALITFGSPARAIDIVFVPDAGYGDMANISNRQAFLDDIAQLIDDSFWNNNLIWNNIGLFNFWYFDLSGSVVADGRCPIATWPDVSEMYFAEVFILAHKDSTGDCTHDNRSTAWVDDPAMVVHEFSHAAFALPDEYGLGGGYWYKPPILYETEADCISGGVPWQDCQPIASGNFWRAEDNHCDTMSCFSDHIDEYGLSDWIVIRHVLTNLDPDGGSPVVNEPEIFSPETWLRFGEVEDEPVNTTATELIPVPPPPDGREIAVLTLVIISSEEGEIQTVRLQDARILNNYAPNVFYLDGPWKVELQSETETISYGILDPRRTEAFMNGSNSEGTIQPETFIETDLTWELVVPLYEDDRDLGIQEIRVLDTSGEPIFSTMVDRANWVVDQ